ncbi:hypothetical protein AB0D83_35855 [Streptomyces decoyicus]
MPAKSPEPEDPRPDFLAALPRITRLSAAITRARLIEPTDAGTEAANRYLAFLLGWFTDALADWPRQDRDDLVRLLSRFADDVTTRVALLDEELSPRFHGRPRPVPSVPCPAAPPRCRPFGRGVGAEEGVRALRECLDTLNPPGFAGGWRWALRDGMP